ncbi:MAG: 16S rRNA (cytidine(1402)-2'-O)-methyltransferase [Bryobacterales bacterium]|nr:16S rRNA (cytidine(1402)-2'-O)-methyltransferase [Bryobacterales bacterium]
MPGQLYVVATPIGNLEDMTFRAVRTLKDVAAIACEDTRQTRKLLDHFNLATPLVSYHEHNERERAPELVERMLAGESIALVSDAGTPLVSDPGFRLVSAAIEAHIHIVPIPGPSAPLAALAASGLPNHAFRFLGFMPNKSTKRDALLSSLKSSDDTAIFFEAPHRIVDTLAAIQTALGDHRPVVLGRELTKLHEEFLRGTVAEVHAQLSRRPAIKGEFTVLIGPAPEPAPADTPSDYRKQVDVLTGQGIPRMDAVKQVARRHGLGKRDLYRILFEEEA